MCHNFLLFLWCSCVLQVGYNHHCLEEKPCWHTSFPDKIRPVNIPCTEDKGHRLPRLQRSSLSPPEVPLSLRLQRPLYGKLPERDILVVQLPVSHPSSCKWPRKLMVLAQGTWTIITLVCHCPLYLKRPDVSPSPPRKAMWCSHYVP